MLSNPELSNSEVNLLDIQRSRLDTSEIMVRRIGWTPGLKDLHVSATTDRRKAPRSTDFVILMMQVGGYKPATVIDFEIPIAFGLRQTIVDTLGVGGTFPALRTIPAVLDIIRDMESDGTTLLIRTRPTATCCSKSAPIRQRRRSMLCVTSSSRPA